MKRVITAIMLIIIIPVLLITSLYVADNLMQSEPIEASSSAGLYQTSYIEENRLYELKGNIGCFHGAIIMPTTYNSSYSDSTFETRLSEIAKNYATYTSINKLKEIKCDDCIADGSYKATVCFFLKLPANQDYALWIPAEFCEYRVYVNGEFVKQSETFRSKTPVYASAFYVELPSNATGNYEVIINFISPLDYYNFDSDTVLIGTLDEISDSFLNVSRISLALTSLIIFTVIFSLIQIIAFKSDKRLRAFILLSVATFLVTAFTDGRIIMLFIPKLPYQLGSFMEIFSIPLFLVALLNFTKTLYPDFYPKKIGIVFDFLFLIPFLNALSLGQFIPLRCLSTLVLIIPYAICLYVFVVAYEKQEKLVGFYGTSVLATIISVLLCIVTQKFTIPGRFEYMLGYIVFAFTMVIIMAEEYARQNRDEIFYTEELKRQLAAMQASENAFLNAQMKPHFLYNTLNTIADLCVTDSKKAQKLINSLSEYLKLILSIDNMDETVPLRRELELVEAYTDIEKERFPSISFYTDLPIRLPAITMPPLTIQPLIENAIKHGVRKLNKPGVVTLRIVNNPDSVDFFVSDNGIGMDEETIHKLLTRVPKENQSIGVYNIDKRLKHLYKKGLTVESTPGLGTCVSFKVYKFM